MIVLGTKEVTIASMLLPGHWRRALESPDLDRKVKTIQRFGVLQDPMVRASDTRLVFGATRVAACQKAGLETVACKMVDISDEEIELVRRIENYDRFHDPKPQEPLAELVRRLEATMVDDALPAFKGGRSAKSKARELAAAERGIQPESVRMAEYRAEKRKEADGGPVVVADIETLGMELEPKFAAQLGSLQGHIADAAKAVGRAMSELTRVQTEKLPINEARVKALYATLEDAGFAIRALSPAAICPFCKGVDGVQEQCSGCAKNGYVTRDQLSQVPKGFLDTDKPVVLVNGIKKRLEDVLPAEPEAKAAPTETGGLW